MAVSTLKAIGIDHVVLHVRELERSKRFYTGVLGLTVAWEGSSSLFMWCGEQQLILFERPDLDQSGVELNHVALRLVAGDWEAVKAALASHGLRVYGRPGADDELYFNDPDGHKLQLLLPDEVVVYPDGATSKP